MSGPFLSHFASGAFRASRKGPTGQFGVAIWTAIMDGPERHVGAKFGKLLRFAEILVELSADLLACLEVYP